jgi:NAD+ diphosphatase
MAEFMSGIVAPADASGGRFFHVVGSAIYVSDRVEVDGEDAHHFLGMHGDEACWGVDVPHGIDPSDGAALDLRAFHGRSSEAEWLIAGRAVQIVEWARTSRFCGRCGTATHAVPGERATKCPLCGLLAFPRIAPAMITLVTRGEAGPDQQVLLARGVQFSMPMYSCLAGFVEPGETLEGTVIREVFEEVGLTVGNVRYQASQPWPFPHSLMIGFRAEYVGGEIACDPKEILDAGWYGRDRLPMIPPGISIARKLIDAWIAEV